VTTSTLSAKGWVVIPSELRKKYGLRPGDKVNVREEDGRIVVVPLLRDPIRELRGMFKGGPSMTVELVEEHRREVEQDEREVQNWMTRQSKRRNRG
jgi:AbrB family looped-hinge helix DNA binding protein